MAVDGAPSPGALRRSPAPQTLADPFAGDVVTGEAVVLDLRAASFASRIVAALLDALVLGLLLVGLLVAAFALGSELDEAAAAAIVLGLSILVLVVVPALVESLTRGRTVGKLVCGLRAVRDDGGPIRFRQAIVRSLLGAFELWALAGSPAILCSLVNARGKRFGDLLAGTYVVRERTAARHVPLPPMPAELAGWARAADIGRIPDRLSVAARQFLGRTHQLAPQSREQLARSLAEAVARHVAPPPPAGTNPERFVAAVLVERHDRELRKLQRQRDRLAELSRAVGRPA
ncbi:putative RDD family membrane protein YckC [Kineococcus xinjiangensis]|uniref:Putative RDD family membrane protein YckC n=1 Tax=Kineococcus xinjiangensis TaxID=512762 RepID=A0A2S6IUF4_9ACTN|nr:RDD family protein [Kineococcus xinjiangensis]PPK97810.1 putative RDD family membrane protein YckC [Kineococcus xinjiangensis]